MPLAARLENQITGAALENLIPRYTAFSGLTPVVHLNGTAWIVRIQELAAIPGSELRERVGSLEEHRDALKRALDILFDGI